MKKLLIASLLLIAIGCGTRKEKGSFTASALENAQWTQGGTISDSVWKHSGTYTSLFANPLELTQPEYRFYPGNGYKAILTISTPDSTGTVKVRFDKSRITWVNDSTFTYRVEK